MSDDLRFHSLAAEVAARFVDLRAEKIDEAINEVLREVGEFFEVDLVCMTRFSPKGEVLEVAHLWHSEQFPAFVEAKSYAVKQTYPKGVAHLVREGSLVFGRLEEFPRWPKELEIMNHLGIVAGVSVRVSFDGSELEFLSLESLSNRDWPDDAVEHVQFLGQILFKAVGRRYAQQEREETLCFQSLASRIAARFVGLPADEVDKTVSEVLREIGEYFEVDRVAMARFSLAGKVGKVLEATHLWHSERFPSFTEATAYAFEQIYPNTTSHLLQEGSLVFGRFEEFFDWTPESQMLQHLGIKAAVAVRTSSDSSGLKALVLDSLDNRDWPDDVAERAQFLGRVLFNAVDRKRAEEQRRKAFREIERLKQLVEEENIYLRKEIKVRHPHSEIIGNSEELQRVLSQVEQVADTNASVVIMGETGTGKELIAQHLHSLSGRSKNPLIIVNCSALPTALVESELFGREKGAYTGAMTRQVGRFELANRSAIFLDEVGELPLEIQSKLLRVLQNGTFERLGTPHSTKVDVRIIAATNRNLQDMVKEGKFREDLYYRLNVIQVVVPPLRERPGDIPLLVWHFVENFCADQGRKIERIKKGDMARLQTYSWPGNVRELRNLIERAVILSRGETLEVDWTATALFPVQEDSSSAPHRAVETAGETLEEVERSYILSVLKRCNWRVGGESGAAKILGIKRTTLDSRLKKLGIERPKTHRHKKKQTTS
jgi:transcriptional regulator with GAF, ATPase, and Fis domain